MPRTNTKITIGRSSENGVTAVGERLTCSFSFEDFDMRFTSQMYRQFRCFEAKYLQHKSKLQTNHDFRCKHDRRDQIEFVASHTGYNKDIIHDDDKSAFDRPQSKKSWCLASKK
jgi:hypothetical protein